MGSDGRQDKHTRAMVAVSTGKVRMRIITEEHEAVTEEPSGCYLTHFAPEAPSSSERPALKVAQGLFNILEQHNSTESLQFLSGDSTAMNTGWKGGATPSWRNCLEGVYIGGYATSIQTNFHFGI